MPSQLIARLDLDCLTLVDISDDGLTVQVSNPVLETETFEFPGVYVTFDGASPESV